MLNQHYLANMFPTNRPWANGSDPDDIPFLDRVVEVDSATVAKRDVTAAAQLTILRQNSLPLDALSQTSISASRSRISANPGFEGVELGEGDALRAKDLAGAEGSRITVAMTKSSDTVQARGKRVRDLSRLWRYMGGECPVD